MKALSPIADFLENENYSKHPSILNQICKKRKNLYAVTCKIIIMITADFCILPMGIESSEIGEYVAEAVEVIKASGIKYELTAMGTQMETESLEELYKVVQDTQEAIFKMGPGRVYSVLKVDDRRDRENRTLDAKVKTVEDLMEKKE